jgi:hypothetical protein
MTPVMGNPVLLCNNGIERRKAYFCFTNVTIFCPILKCHIDWPPDGLFESSSQQWREISITSRSHWLWTPLSPVNCEKLGCTSPPRQSDGTWTRSLEDKSPWRYIFLKSKSLKTLIGKMAQAMLLVRILEVLIMIGSSTKLTEVSHGFPPSSRKILEQYLKPGHGRFFPRPSQFIIHCHPRTRRDII